MAKKILVIEDSAFERMAIINILKKDGYDNIVEAEDGKEALEKYKKEKCELVLLDLRLPGEPTSLDVFKELKKINSRCKCIVISIVKNKETIDEALKLGVKAYFVKPITPEKLIPKVKEVLG